MYQLYQMSSWNDMLVFQPLWAYQKYSRWCQWTHRASYYQKIFGLPST